jgi:hypothetical protein
MNSKTNPIRKQKPMQAYMSNYTPYGSTSGLPNLGSALFASPTGTTELILNSNSGQIAWGTNDNGNLDSTVNYPTPPGDCPFVLTIPQSTYNGTPGSQTPATLAVGGPTGPLITYSNAPAYSLITNVMFEAMVNIGGTPVECVSLKTSGVNILFDDGTNATSNPSTGFTDPIATMGGLSCPTSPGSFVAVQATPVAPYAPVMVTVSGNVQLLSTDGYYKNAGDNLGITSVQLRILVYGS